MKTGETCSMQVNYLTNTTPVVFARTPPLLGGEFGVVSLTHFMIRLATADGGGTRDIQVWH
jgi:hypothetical protein